MEEIKSDEKSNDGHHSKDCFTESQELYRILEEIKPPMILSTLNFSHDDIVPGPMGLSPQENLQESMDGETENKNEGQSSATECMEGLAFQKKSGLGVRDDDLLSLPEEEDDYPTKRRQSLLKVAESLSDVDRLMMIKELVDSCNPSELHHISKNIIRPKLKRDFLALLPKELALYILELLEPEDLLKVEQTSRFWQSLCKDNLLWRNMCLKYRIGGRHTTCGGKNEEPQDTKVNRPGGSSNASGIGSGNFLGLNPLYTEETDEDSMDWKAVYMKQYKIDMNWRYNRYKLSTSAAVLRGHDQYTITCLQLSDDWIVSGSDDTTLRVWSAVTGQWCHTLHGHSGGVWCSKMVGNLVISGGTDKIIRVWNAKTAQCLRTLRGHTATVRCLDADENRIVSGSRDTLVKVWSIRYGECIHTLIGHLAPVRCIVFNGTIAVSGAYDKVVRVWDTDVGTCLHALYGHSERVYSIMVDGPNVISGSVDGSIRVWDVETGLCKKVLTGHRSLTTWIEWKDNQIVTGNADSFVKIWDINTGQCLFTLSDNLNYKHKGSITCVQITQSFVISASDDGTVKLWDRWTGKFVRNLVVLDSRGRGGVVWKIRASETKLVCAVGSRNGTEVTKLIVLDFGAGS